MSRAVPTIECLESRRLRSVAGDLNRDGAVNNQDIAAFVQALTDPAGFQSQYGYAPVLLGDLNHDGLFNNQDIASFVALLTGGRPAPQAAPMTIRTKVSNRSPFASGRTLSQTLGDDDAKTDVIAREPAPTPVVAA